MNFLKILPIIAHREHWAWSGWCLNTLNNLTTNDLPYQCIYSAKSVWGISLILNLIRSIVPLEYICVVLLPPITHAFFIAVFTGQSWNWIRDILNQPKLLKGKSWNIISIISRKIIDVLARYIWDHVVHIREKFCRIMSTYGSQVTADSCNISSSFL